MSSKNVRVTYTFILNSKVSEIILRRWVPPGKTPHKGLSDMRDLETCLPLVQFESQLVGSLQTGCSANSEIIPSQCSCCQYWYLPKINSFLRNLHFLN